MSISAPDHLAAGALIQARLLSEAPVFKDVAGASALAMLESRTRRSPVAFVLYDGDVLPTSADAVAGAGAARMVRQRWMVVVAVRNVADQGVDERLTTEAGLALGAAIQALSGWAPSPNHRPLVRVAAASPEYSPGLGLFPLMFETTLVNVSSSN